MSSSDLTFLEEELLSMSSLKVTSFEVTYYFDIELLSEPAPEVVLEDSRTTFYFCFYSKVGTNLFYF